MFWNSAAASGSYFPLFSLHCLLWICAETELHSKIIFQEVSRQIKGWLHNGYRRKAFSSSFFAFVMKSSSLFVLGLNIFYFLDSCFLFLSCLGFRWWLHLSWPSVCFHVITVFGKFLREFWFWNKKYYENLWCIKKSQTSFLPLTSN